MPTALVTGVNGFTGKHLIPELRRAGFTIFGLGREASETHEATTVKCDLTDRMLTIEVVKQVCPDVVIHLAGIAFPAHDDVEEIYRSNVLGTRNLLEGLALCHRAPRAVLLASSANIYGNAEVIPVTELTRPVPTNDYAVSKLAMEHMARQWYGALPITIVRPFNYTGVGQSSVFVLPKIVDHFKRRAPFIELGNINVIRDFSDVRTVVRCYRLLIEGAYHGEVFNICSGVGHSLQEIIAMMRKLSGHDMEVVVNPAFVRGNEIHKLIGARAKLDAAIRRVPSIPLHETLSWMLVND